MIRKFAELLGISKQPKKEVETQTTLLQKKANTFNIECAIDEKVVDCEGEAFKQDAINYYTGIPAPGYLEDDSWFGSAPELTEKQITIKEAHEQAVADKQLLDESETNESADIHQKLYEAATKSWTTVTENLGGSENFQEGPGGWNSGNGFNRVAG